MKNNIIGCTCTPNRSKIVIIIGTVRSPIFNWIPNPKVQKMLVLFGVIAPALHTKQSMPATCAGLGQLGCMKNPKEPMFFPIEIDPGFSGFWFWETLNHQIWDIPIHFFQKHEWHKKWSDTMSHDAAAWSVPVFPPIGHQPPWTGTWWSKMVRRIPQYSFF